MICKFVALSLAITLVTAAAQAQYGTAPNGYYPDKYRGATFTGTVTETTDDAITLAYTKKDKTETFTGRLEASCHMSTQNGQPMKASDLLPGTVLTAYYDKETHKVEGRKEPVNMILAITVSVWQGKPIADEKRKLYFCTNEQHLQFRAWSTQ